MERCIGRWLSQTAWLWRRCLQAHLLAVSSRCTGHGECLARAGLSVRQHGRVEAALHVVHDGHASRCGAQAAQQACVPPASRCPTQCSAMITNRCSRKRGLALSLHSPAKTSSWELPWPSTWSTVNVWFSRCSRTVCGPVLSTFPASEHIQESMAEARLLCVCGQSVKLCIARAAA